MPLYGLTGALLAAPGKRDELAASLQAPGVGQLIEKARPIIAGMSGRSVLTVLGGKGLPTA